MWAATGLLLLLVALSARFSAGQDARVDHGYPESEAVGLEVMQENPCPKGCLPEKRARSVGMGGPILDVLTRRSALDKNFMRFGRAPPEVSPSRDENVYRASRAKNTNFIRLGRGKSDNFMRFGRRDDFMRFGRKDDFMRFGRRDDFMRFGRKDAFLRFGKAGDKVLRLGPANGTAHLRDDFVRFGRNSEEESPDDDVSDDAVSAGSAQSSPVQDSDEEDRRWKRDVKN